MPIEINPHVQPVLYGTLPSGFQELAAYQIFWMEEDNNILIEKALLKDAEEAFKETELFKALQQVFEQFPTFDQMLLQPACPT